MRQASTVCAAQYRILPYPFFLVLLALIFALSTVQPAAANPRYAAYVLDTNTGQVLFSRNADAQRFPASLTKIMTVYLLFEALEAGRVNPSTRIPISARAAAEVPTKIGLRAGSTITVDEAIKALIVRSANDIATAVAEFLGGSEARFAQMMTAKARQLGMNSTTFRNAHGLPNNQQVTTARDMAILGLAVREHFPQYYSYFSARSATVAGRNFNSHNRLLGRVNGADGIKTGFIRASGFNLVTSVRTGGRSLVAVVMGGRTGASRDDHMAALIREHLPRASTTRTAGTLVAKPSRTTTAPAAVAATLPNRMPVPVMRPRDRQPTVASAPSSQQVVTVARAEAAYAPQPDMARISPPLPVGQGSESPAAQAIDTMNTSATSVSTKPSGGWAVQVGSLGSKSEAEAFLMRTTKQAGAILNGAEPFTEPFTRNGVNYVRARFGGYSSSDEAWKACNALKSRNIDCFAAEL